MVDAPCGWVPDLGCCAEWGTFMPDTVQQRAIDYATTVLWAATGRRFGLCSVTVRPCGRDRGNIPAIAGFQWLVSGGTWIPYIDTTGTWRNCSCGVICHCYPDCEASLPGPVNSITSVTVDGTVVDPAAYRVDNGRWLVRTDGNCWPDCQDFDVDSGTGTFIVTYLRGEPVPAALLSVAGVLACEYAKACVGSECRLPGRVRSISRSGVEIAMVDTDTLLNRGLTGIIEVDQVILAYNPLKLPHRLRIWSPDKTFPRVVTSP